VPVGQQVAVPVEEIQIWLFGQHCPLTQLAIDGQWLPQLPQLLGSLLVFVQVPPHSVKPVGQAHCQVLVLKTCPSGQTLETHVLPQGTVPEGHAQVKVLGLQ